ncbi:hypothetical protein L917_07572 [Phytophthora nicotianae]|uniref:Uncharacterized protein n=1 Tax=Phytophthora nicotianae TaxID=4792 RepID=W2LAJ5_PHYNI|nr:hypothetical protein L917_07572 [Phytophthora nicotianae]
MKLPESWPRFPLKSALLFDAQRSTLASRGT